MAKISYSRKENEVIEPVSEAQEAFLNTDADLAVIDGPPASGKTFALVMEAARNVGNENYRGVIISGKVRLGGVDTLDSGSLLSRVGGEFSRGNAFGGGFGFKSGAKVDLAMLDGLETRLRWAGTEFQFAGFDGLQWFGFDDFHYLLSRLRGGNSGVKPYARATSNVANDRNGWLARFADWWIDRETGHVVAERSGVKRWFIMTPNGGALWFATKADAQEFHEGVKGPFSAPRSFTMISTYEGEPKAAFKGVKEAA